MRGKKRLGETVRQRDICGCSGDDRYVGGDPFIAMPTKADNRTKTQGTERGLHGPVCVYVCLCSGSSVRGP